MDGINQLLKLLDGNWSNGLKLLIMCIFSVVWSKLPPKNSHFLEIRWTEAIGNIL